MVTQIYTPYVTPYTKPPLGKPLNPVGPKLDEQPAPQQFGSDSFEQQQPSKGLVTVTEQTRRQKIQIGSILKDFNSTLDALGADETVREEVNTYLKTVEVQAQKTSPSIPYINQTLKTAADSMDGFITNALGQKSKVVRDWVDALLLQDIDYQGISKSEDQSNTPVTETTAQVSSSPTPEAAPSTSDELSVTDADNTEQSEEQPQPNNLKVSLNREEKQILKTAIDSAQGSIQEQDYASAIETLTNVLPSLDGKDRPDLEGKVHHMLGRIYDQANRPDDALSHFDSARQAFEASGQSKKLSHVLYATATVHDEQGQLDDAVGFYRQSLALDESLGNKAGMARTLNDVGNVQLRQGTHTDSIQSFLQATLVLPQDEPLSPVDQGFLADVYRNLASAYQDQGQYPQALESYQAALSNVRGAKDKVGYRQVLENIADLYEAAGQPDQAEKALSRLRQVS
ncbi:MAG: tetratricopeptide repeat protein [Vampirovibrio sp.]|nr:tetratricopeptide repeat protein [Vampirovibrio sp.]